jgi:hypothetical protein
MENPFSAVINGVEHVVDDMEQLIGKAVGELESLGIAAFGGMGAFIHFLVSIGEDPVHVISSLVAHISRFGGDVIHVLEETAHGVMTYGVTKFFEMKATQALAPIKDALNQQTVRGSQVSTVHQHLRRYAALALGELKAKEAKTAVQQALACETDSYTVKLMKEVLKGLED